MKANNNLTPKLYIREKDDVFNFSRCENGLEYNDIKAKIDLTYKEDGFDCLVSVANKGNADFSPESLEIDFGIDTYMEKYPDWNEKWFPNYFRCEKTHFSGCFISPLGEIISVVCETPVSSYQIEYNKGDLGGYGHRIEWLGVSLCHCEIENSPHSQVLTALKAGEQYEWSFHFDYCKDLKDFQDKLAFKYNIPVISSGDYTVPLGESFSVTAKCGGQCSLEITSPDGSIITEGDFIADQYGLYSVKAIAENGKVSTGYLYCRRSYDWYLKTAAKEALAKPPHATTHCESWYGFFTAYLELKHFPNEEKQQKLDALFDEVMSLVFDFEQAEPLVIPVRVQNASAFISLLVDKYESDPENQKSALELASRFGDWLISCQGKDGAYYRNTSHYTCVIYPAKSMLELSEVEGKAAWNTEYFKSQAQKHYNSAKLATDNLVELLENIGTEGEHTLEDGMLSCSVLQIATFALTLPEEEREKYIKAAEHILSVHACLRQNATADCRVRGCTIRYWEAQYDIQLKKNLQTSPHGWSAWVLYGLYYLYLLTGKLKYLKELHDGMGACLQLVSLDGELRWAFVVDPYIKSVNRTFVPDTDKPITDGYRNITSIEPAYRGKFTDSVVGEEYLPMISGWFRTGQEQKVTGGFTTCPLILKDRNVEVDKQGGCCDNDVHEIFKCLEETVYKKAFIHEENGELICYNCKADLEGDKITVTAIEEIDTLVIKTDNPSQVLFGNSVFNIETGLHIKNQFDCG